MIWSLLTCPVSRLISPHPFSSLSSTFAKLPSVFKPSMFSCLCFCSEDWHPPPPTRLMSLPPGSLPWPKSQLGTLSVLPCTQDLYITLLHILHRDGVFALGDHSGVRSLKREPVPSSLASFYLAHNRCSISTCISWRSEHMNNWNAYCCLLFTGVTTMG